MARQRDKGATPQLSGGAPGFLIDQIVKSTTKKSIASNSDSRKSSLDTIESRKGRRDAKTLRCCCPEQTLISRRLQNAASQPIPI